jgi:hypothetical protein
MSNKKNEKEPVLFLPVRDYHHIRMMKERCKRLADDLALLESWLDDYNIEVDEKGVRLARNECDLEVFSQHKGFKQVENVPSVFDDEEE